MNQEFEIMSNHGLLLFFIFAKITITFMKEVNYFMKKFDIDYIKVLSFLGAGLGMIATAISGVAQKKSMKDMIEKEVEEAMKTHQ